MENSTPATELQQALSDVRVTRAMHLALRDARIVAHFRELRGQGFKVESAIEKLRGPHVDADGQPYFLSDERIRTIVYQK
jgi:hypothetical protein